MACISGYTNGIYSFVDCCGIYRNGVSSGETVCLDQSYSATSINVIYDTGSTCTQSCSGTSYLSYSFTVTGTCELQYHIQDFQLRHTFSDLTIV